MTALLRIPQVERRLGIKRTAIIHGAGDEEMRALVRGLVEKRAV